MSTLTDRQEAVFAAVKALSAELGHSPSQAEIVTRTKLARTTVRLELAALVAAGRIRHTPGQRRAYSVPGASS